MKVIKKDGTLEEFDGEKIVNAVNKSASRVMITLDDTAFHEIVGAVLAVIEEKGLTDIPVAMMHNIVEQVLDKYDPQIATSYRNYRNYKQDFVHVLDKVFQKSQVVRFQGDKENANTDSALVATKRCLIFNELNKRLYRKFFMTQEELQACRDGYIYIHDQSARLDTMNCCLFRVNEVMKGGFEMGNIWYNEPKTLDVFSMYWVISFLQPQVSSMEDSPYRKLTSWQHLTLRNLIKSMWMNTWKSVISRPLRRKFMNGLCGR